MPKIDRLAIYERDGGLCGFCGQPVPAERFHIDHSTPRALGGTDVEDNLRPAHVRCNIAAGQWVRAEACRLRWPHGATLRLRILVQTHQRLHELAKREKRSDSAQAAYLIEKALQVGGGTDG